MTHSPIFWPTSTSENGFCYGWSHPLICIAGVVGAPSNDRAKDMLQSAISSAEWHTVTDCVKTQPSVIARCKPGLLKEGRHALQLEMCDNSGTWLLEERTVVQFVRPRRDMMQFYSFDSRELDILPAHDATASTRADTAVASVLAHDMTRPAVHKIPALDSELLTQINLSGLLSDLVERGSSRPLSKTVPREIVAQVQAALRSDNTIPPRLTSLTLRATNLVRHLLKEISVTIEQLDIRIEQSIFVAKQLPVITRAREASFLEIISRYVRFYNCIWLVLNDMILGVAFGSFLCENNIALAKMLDNSLQYHLVESIQRALLWLNNWPAGLKLNTELSQFYCHSLIGIVSAWGSVLHHAAPYIPGLIWIVGAMGSCGLTMVVSLLSDCLSLFTVHLYICYSLSTVIYAQQLSLAGSLWNLFRGKRFNVLRNRLDSWDYDLDQLLLGTVLFTLVAFLHPTILTYYVLFAAVRLGIITIYAILDSTLALLNHFPLFALMLRTKDPMRLPGGITIERDSSRSGGLLLKNQAATFASIFIHYGFLARRLLAHYHPLRLLRLLMAGRPITSIPRAMIRLSMIISERS